MNLFTPAITVLALALGLIAIGFWGSRSRPNSAARFRLWVLYPGFYLIVLAAYLAVRSASEQPGHSPDDEMTFIDQLGLFLYLPALPVYFAIQKLVAEANIARSLVLLTLGLSVLNTYLWTGIYGLLRWSARQRRVSLRKNHSRVR